MELEKYKYIRTQADAVLYFIQAMDAEMVDTLLDPARTYQDFSKDVFIKKLSDTFGRFKGHGDSYLDRYPGFCNGATCERGCTGFRLVGNVSCNYLDVIIKVKDGVVEDIYDCARFHCHNQNIEKRGRIGIDMFLSPI